MDNLTSVSGIMSSSYIYIKKQKKKTFEKQLEYTHIQRN